MYDKFVEGSDGEILLSTTQIYIYNLNNQHIISYEGVATPIMMNYAFF